MILIDTGPLVALILRGDPNHARCVEAARRLPRAGMTTSWPCFTEAMYLLHRGGGHPAQVALWRMQSTGRLTLHLPTLEDAQRMSELMNRYRDVPMDLGDASLVVVAERIGLRDVFTLDSHFRIYRLQDGTFLNPIP